ncbi:MAG: sigma-54 dependent transcriptional regulator [Devosiaceae bacterium]|nr:sigma-54 dependent transcriptional regulator [Devosiaceae bacterium]
MPLKNGTTVVMRFLAFERNPSSFRQMQHSFNIEFGDTVELHRVETFKETVSALRQNQYDVILFDLQSAHVEHSPEEALTKICRYAQNALIIAMSEGGSVSNAVQAMRAGAHDYMTKPINMSAFNTHISELGLRHGNTNAFNVGQKATQAEQFEGFVGASAQMSAIYDQIKRIAPSSAPVFITGESGTGKEVCAVALHQRSARSQKPFIAINCSAIPHDLMEGEIFGVAKGAFTGAHKDRAGAAESADGGVLFLDEIGEMDLKLQAKLLRFLQTGEINRVGETQTRRVDVRVICATNRNPLKLIEEKKFREDLFYRLHVLPIHLPPLRQRTCDILPLAQTFLARFSREENKNFSGFSPETANLIVSREWPGNVRQLQNMIRRAVVMFDGPQIDMQMISVADITSVEMPQDTHVPSPVQTFEGTIEPMWRQEQIIIETALARYNGNISLAAAALEISPSTIYRKKQAWEQMQAQTMQGKTMQRNMIVA